MRLIGIWSISKLSYQWLIIGLDDWSAGVGDWSICNYWSAGINGRSICGFPILLTV